MARGKGSRLMVGKVKAKATAGEVVSMCRWRRETSTIWMHNMLDDCRGVSWRAGSVRFIHSSASLFGSASLCALHNRWMQHPTVPQATTTPNA